MRVPPPILESEMFVLLEFDLDFILFYLNAISGFETVHERVFR